MRRQAMHEERRLAGLTQQLFIYLIRLEHTSAGVEFLFLPHACPCVRVHSVSTGHIFRIRRPIDLLTLRWTVLGGTNSPEVQADEAACLPERPGHVVPIAHIHDRAIGKTVPHVRQCHEIGQSLAWVLVVA
jgi:hypothetical protein